MPEIDGSTPSVPDPIILTPETATGTTSDTTDVSGTVNTPGGVTFADAATAFANSYASTDLMHAGASTLTTPTSDTDSAKDVVKAKDLVKSKGLVKGAHDGEIEEKKDKDERDIDKLQHRRHEDFSDAQSNKGGGAESDSGDSSGQSGSHSSSDSGLQAKIIDKASPSVKSAVSTTEDRSENKASTDAPSDTNKTGNLFSRVKIFTDHKLKISDSLNAEMAIEIASYHHHRVDKIYQSYRKNLMIKAKEHSSNVSIYLSKVKGISYHIFHGVVTESNDLTALKYTSQYKNYLARKQSRQDSRLSALNKLSTYSNSMKNSAADLAAYTSIKSATKKIDNLMKSNYNDIDNESAAIDQNMTTVISDIEHLSDKVQTLIDALSSQLQDASVADKSKKGASVADKAKIKNARTKLIAYQTELSKQLTTLRTEREKLNTDNSNITTAQKKLADKKSDLSKNQKALISKTISSNGSHALTEQASINATLSSIKGIQGDVQDQWNTLPITVQSSASAEYSDFNTKYTTFNTHESNYNTALTETQQSLRNYFASTIPQLQASRTELSKYSNNNPIAKLLLGIINSKIKFAKSNDGAHSATIVILEEEAREWHSQATNDLKKNSYGEKIDGAQKAYNKAKAAYDKQKAEYDKLNENPLKKPKTEFIPGSESPYGHALAEMDQLLKTLDALNINSPDANIMSQKLHKGPQRVDTSGILPAWKAYQNYKDKIPGLKQTISNLKLAMEVCTAGVLVSCGTTAIAEAAMGITLLAKEHDLSTAESNAESSFELYTMYKHKAMTNQASNTATWKSQISAKGSKVATLLSADAQKITHELKKEEKKLKHNVDNLQKILELIHHISQKKHDEKTQSFL